MRLIIDELLEDDSVPEMICTIKHHFFVDDFNILEQVVVEAFKLNYEVSDTEELEVKGVEIFIYYDIVS
ncbi:MAG: ribonuclease E inhibitor RraB [Sodalis sp. (in: enterobacteria)]